jgi:hypothetical protein
MVEPAIVDYFFSGAKYIRVRRGDTGPGKTDSGYPAPISNWGWPDGFGANGIDAALYSGSVNFFFKGTQYIQVTRGITGPYLEGPDGKPEIAGPFPISKWGWPDGFGKNGIDAALWSGTVTYFFSGNQYIRVTRTSDTDLGKTDSGYPRSIYAGWGWNNDFNQGVKGGLPSGLVCYFFRGKEYIRVSRGFEIGGFIDPGYPAPISNWGWPDGFGENGIDAALYSGGPLQDPGATGLSSNWNYVLANGGKNITGLSATINIDNDLVSPTADNGFSIQLNCESPASPDGSGIPTWQQFVFDNAPNDTTIVGLMNFWEWNGSAGWKENYATETTGWALPAANTIKAGSVLTITPVFNSNDEIPSCNFTYTDPTGKSSTQLLVFNYTKLAPITSVTVNIGGYGYGLPATFTSGQGTITYSASQPLTAQAAWAETAETSNIVYEELPPVVNVSQLFGVAPPGWKAPDVSGIPRDKPLTSGTKRIVPKKN